MSNRSVWGDTLDGRYWSDRRSTSMTETEPPDNYRWHHHESSGLLGADSTRTELALEDEAESKTRQLVWLDQFDLEISLSSENGYRYWRWLGERDDRPSSYTDRSGSKRRVMYWERRPWGDPMPLTPGLWPADR